MEPFDLLNPESPAGPLQAVFWPHEAARRALVELTNTLAAVRHVWEVGPVDTLRVGREFGVDLAEEARPERLELYRRYVAHHVEGDDWIGDPLAFAHGLRHLARTLFLEPIAAESVHDAVLDLAVYRATEDHHLDDEEAFYLEALAHAFDRHAATFAQTIREGLRAQTLDLAATYLGDDLLAPDEEAELTRRVNATGAQLPADVVERLSKAQWRWRLLHAPLPRLDRGRLRPFEEGSPLRFRTEVSGVLRFPKTTPALPAEPFRGTLALWDGGLTLHCKQFWRAVALGSGVYAEIGGAPVKADAHERASWASVYFGDRDTGAWSLRFQTLDHRDAFLILLGRLSERVLSENV